MDTLDEKANGAPPMEVEEIVSVNDRELRTRHSPVSGSHNRFSVPSDEAFAAKHMPDLGHDVKEFKVYTWKLANWKKLEKKLTSPEFECGGHKRYAQHTTRLSLSSHFRGGAQAYTPLPLRQFQCASKRYCVCVLGLRRS